MLDTTSKKILRLLETASSPEVRGAAARILAELGLREKTVSQTLCAALDDADPSVRAAALTAAGKLRLEQALPKLLERVSHGGSESELAAQSAARLGAKGAHALRDLMHKVAPGLRRRIAAALAVTGSTAAVESLLDSDPGVVDAATRSLSGEIPSMDPTHRHSLTEHLLELLAGTGPAARLSVASETAIVRLLAALGDGRAESVLWDRTEAGHPVEVRAAALQGLGSSAEAATKDKLKVLMRCASDADFRVAAPALMILKNQPVDGKTRASWLSLLDAPDPAVRLLAIEKLGQEDAADVAAGLLKQLGHRDQGLRDAALARLSRLVKGHQALAQGLLEAKTPDEAWLLARTQAPFVGDYGPALLQQIFETACTYLENGDRRTDALFFVLREADARQLQEDLEQRALTLRKKKNYETALRFLRMLARDPACGAGVRLELAACGLKLSPHDLSPEARAADHCLEQFASLLQAYSAETLDFVTNAKWLEPEELFYLGFHFVEKEKQEKQFGGEVLRLAAERAGRTKLGRDAKSKRKSAGFDD
jgi:HEAT repeat protein